METPKDILGSKEHLDSFKIYLNAAKIIVVQNFKTVQRKKTGACALRKKHMSVLLESLLHRTLTLVD